MILRLGNLSMKGPMNKGKTKFGIMETAAKMAVKNVELVLL